MWQNVADNINITVNQSFLADDVSKQQLKLYKWT
jgi:hypothetical protein